MGSVIRCSRKLWFSAGHRVAGHESVCAHLHGHNYVVYVTAEVDEVGGLDGLGRVVDFGVIKRKVGAWLDAEWDHRFLVWKKDPMAAGLIEVDGKGVVLLPLNPTAENLAYLLLQKARELLGDGSGSDVRVVSVRVWETMNCLAEAVV